MFGYVRAQREDLTIRQDTLYRAAYCGLCREMGRCTGQCLRMTLSYDMVFLYIVRAALRGITPNTKKGRCFVHPLRKRMFVTSDSELEYTAKVSALLTYGKLCDDITDERGIKCFVRKMIKPIFSSAKKRADLGELYAKIESDLAELGALEAQRLQSVDAPADIFGRLLGEVFAYGMTGGEEKIAREIGFRTGRWIYAVDAADDIDDDEKSGSYNPFLLLYGGEIDEERRRLIEIAMQHDLAAAASAADLAETSVFTPIIQNILYMGMSAAAKKAVYKEEQQVE